MSLVYQVLSLNDLDEVFAFAESRLAVSIPDETERTFASWTVPWRKEALQHYLRLGWSFIVRENGKAVGFFLGQPFLFFRGQTQTLWVEHVEARDEAVAAGLVEVAVRLSREKHLQRVLVADSKRLEKQLAPWSPRAFDDSVAEIRTTKG